VAAQAVPVVALVAANMASHLILQHFLLPCQQWCLCLPCLQMLLAAAGGGRGRKGHGKGRGRGGPAYPDVAIHAEDAAATLLGNIKLNVGADSLDMHCSRCGLRVNKKRSPHPTRFTNQGRPLGTLLALLREGCAGNMNDHRAKYSDDVLTYVKRRDARQWAVNGGLPLWWLQQELRLPRPDEPEGEPVFCC